MSSAFESEQTSVGKTPSWLKWLLFILLFASTIAGFFFSALLLRHSATGNSAVFNKPAVLPNTGKFSDFTAFRDKTGFTQPEIEVICHGMGIGKDGIALALIDGQIVAPGTIVRGMRILEITASNILVECNGKTLRLLPGESFTSKK